MSRILKLAADYLEAQSNIVSSNIENMPTERHLRETPKVTYKPSKSPSTSKSKDTKATTKATYETKAKSSTKPKYSQGYTDGYKAASYVMSSGEKVRKMYEPVNHKAGKMEKPIGIHHPDAPAKEKGDKGETYIPYHTEPQKADEEKQPAQTQPEPTHQQKIAFDYTGVAGGLATAAGGQTVSTQAPKGTEAIGLAKGSKTKPKGKDKVVGTTTNSFQNVLKEKAQEEASNDVIDSHSKVASWKTFLQKRADTSSY